MESLGINFKELFIKKHGEQVFKDIVKQIKVEYNGDCDISYIDIVFTVAFISYFGVTDTNKIHLLTKTVIIATTRAKTEAEVETMEIK